MHGVGFDVFGLDLSSTTESYLNLMSYIEDGRLPPENDPKFGLVSLSCSPQHVHHHSHSSSSAEPSSSSVAHCGAHSSSGAKAIFSGSDLFFFFLMMINNDNNNNKYDASTHKFWVDKFFIVDVIDYVD